MRYTYTLLLAAMFVSTAAFAQHQYRDKMEPYPTEDESTANQKPLMVIRYNQDNVYYQTPLYNAVSKTLQVKPTAQFTFVSKIPFTGHPEKDSAYEEQAHANWQNVLQTLSDIGLPEKQMTMHFEKSNKVADNEILIFVQ
jgi:hypothetical protein